MKVGRKLGGWWEVGSGWEGKKCTEGDLEDAERRRGVERRPVDSGVGVDWEGEGSRFVGKVVPSSSSRPLSPRTRSLPPSRPPPALLVSAGPTPRRIQAPLIPSSSPTTTTIQKLEWEQEQARPSPFPSPSSPSREERPPFQRPSSWEELDQQPWKELSVSLWFPRRRPVRSKDLLLRWTSSRRRRLLPPPLE